VRMMQKSRRQYVHVHQNAMKPCSFVSFDAFERKCGSGVPMLRFSAHQQVTTRTLVWNFTVQIFLYSCGSVLSCYNEQLVLVFLLVLHGLWRDAFCFQLQWLIVIIFRMRHIRGEMYIGHSCLSVWLFVPHQIPTLLHGLGCNLGEW